MTKETDHPNSQSRSLSDRVFQTLLQDIYSGRIEQGSTINEVELSQRLGVSRGPIRETVRRLQGIGLVTRTPYVKSRVIKLGVESMLELFEVRMALEGMACRLATERMSIEDIEQLEREVLAAEIPRAEVVESSPKFDFHARIAVGSRNQRLMDALRQDNLNILRLYRTSTSAIIERKTGANEEHVQIVLAMKGRNPALAESLMRSHIGRAAQYMKAQLEEK